MLLIIIIIIIVKFVSDGFLLAVFAERCQMPSPENLWTKPGEHSVNKQTHTQTQKKKNNPPLPAYKLHIFIYLSCKYASNEVCVCIQSVLQ